MIAAFPLFLLGAALFVENAAQLAATGARLLETGDADAARAAFERALTLDPAQYDSLSGLGFIHYTGQRFAAARDVLQRAARLRPASFQTRFLLGASLVGLQDAAAAIPQLQRAVALNPAHADARKLLATQLISLGRYTEALAVLRTPADEETHLLTIEARQGAGDAAGALALAQQASRRFPASASIAAWLGFQMQFAGRFEEARRQLTRALELDPAGSVAPRLLGELCLKEEKYAEAVTWLRQADARSPGDVETLLGLGRALAETGATEEALGVLARAPEDARILLQLSRLYFQSGDEARARATAQRSIDLREKTQGQAPRPAGPR